jgi:hypothetical protein
MAQTNLKGRYYEIVHEFGDPDTPHGLPPFAKFMSGKFDSFDIGESDPKADHSIAIVARLVPFLNGNGITEVFVYGGASRTGGHEVNLRLAEDRRDRIIAELTQLGGDDIFIHIEPVDNTDLREREGVPLGTERKRHRRVLVVFDISNLPDSALTGFVEPPPGLNEETD